MRKKNLADMLRELGPIDDWLLSVEEIQHIIETADCRHLLPNIAQCRECFTAAMFHRQVEILARMKGCTPSDAVWVADQVLVQQTGKAT